VKALLAIAKFFAIVVVLIAGSAWAMSLGFTGPGDAQAIRTSAVIALVVQVVTFAMVRLADSSNVLVGWGIGALVRMVVLIGYALLVVQALDLPPAAALISMVTFFFLCTLVEPLLLKS
jgi:hypothetical protein